jgi:hypothetical protein
MVNHDIDCPYRNSNVVVLAVFLSHLVISAKVFRREHYGVWRFHFIPNSKEMLYPYYKENHTDFSPEVRTSLFRSQHFSSEVRTSLQKSEPASGR